MSLPPFDADKFHLGKLCPLKHDWNNTGKTLKRKPDYSCIECRRIAVRKFRNNNKEKVSAFQKKYRATENFKIAQQKYWSKPDSLEKRKVYNAQYRQRPDYPEMHRRGNAKYAKTEKGKATHQKAIKKYFQTDKGKALGREVVKRRRAVHSKVHATIFTEEERLERMTDFGDCCAYCNNKATTFDHFIPITKGGTHNLGNLIPACKPCNSSKFNHDPENWYKAQPSFSKARWKKILKVLGKTEDTIGQLPLF